MQEGRIKKALAAGALGLYLVVGPVFGVAYATIQEVSSTDFFTSKHGGRDGFLYAGSDLKPIRAAPRRDARAGVSAAARAGTDGCGPSRGSRSGAGRSSEAWRGSAPPRCGR